MRFRNLIVFAPATLLLSWACAPAPHEADRNGPRVVLSFAGDSNVVSGTPFESIGRDGARTEDGAADVRPISERKASGAFGGISALHWNPDEARLLALSDSTHPVLFSFELSIGDDGFRVIPDRRLELTAPEGDELAEWTLDPEGLAGGGGGRLFVSSEGFPRLDPPVAPALLEFDDAGVLLDRLPLDAKFLPSVDGDAPRGVRANRGFESLTLSADGRRLFLASEAPLEQDGAACAIDAGCLVRIVDYPLPAGSAPAREYAYEIDALEAPEDFVEPRGSTGLVELVHLGDAGLLAMERGFATEPGSDRVHLRIRLYQVDLAGAKDVSASPSLSAATGLATLRKRLILDLADVVDRFEAGYRKLDNFEGMCLGPPLPDGARSLILVSDDNYSDRQRTAFLLFRLTLTNGER